MPVEIELKVENLPEGERDLPKLKTIQLPEQHLQRFPELLPNLLGRARNVQELLNDVYPRHIPLLPANSLSLVKKLCIRSYVYRQADIRTHEETIRSLDLLCASNVKLYTLIARGEFFPHGNDQRMTDYLLRFISFVTQILCPPVRRHFGN